MSKMPSIPTDVEVPCMTHPSEWWFPGPGKPKTAHRARELCRTCPIKTSCESLGRETKSSGIFGGVYLHNGKTAQRKCAWCKTIFFLDHRNRDNKVCSFECQHNLEERNKEKARVYARDRRRKARKVQMCVVCGEQVSFEKHPNAKLCSHECYLARRREHAREKKDLGQKSRYNTLLEQGLCTACGKDNPRAPKVLCGECADRKNQAKNAKRHKDMEAQMR